MRAMALATEGLAAMTAEVAVMWMAAVAPNGKGYVGYKQRIADVIKGEDAEYYIVNSTDGDQTSQIKHSIKGRKATESIVNSRNGSDDNGPNRSDKES